MNMLKPPRNIWFIILALIFLATPTAYANKSNAIDWRNYNDVQKETDTEKKKFFIYFSSQSCGYCRLLETKTFKDEDVINYLNDNYRPVQIRTDKERKLAASFKITGVPDLRFLTHEGEPIARWPGFIEAKDLIKLLKFVQSESYQHMSYSDFLKQQ